MRKILIILLLFIIVSLIAIVWFKSKVSPPSAPSLKTTAPSLKLISEKKEFKLGEKIRAQVILDTGKFQVDGVDVVLNYDPQYLKFKEINHSDSVFKTFPPYSVNEGKISFSALSSPGQSFQGKGKIATILFQPLKKGETEISFDFQPNSTYDSNIALHGEGKDILEKVDNLKIWIK